jgi:hypothetical protein
MEDALQYFHTYKGVFLHERACKQGKAKANAQRMELVKKLKVDDETNVDSWTPSKTRLKMNSFWHFISHEIDLSK